MMHAQVSDLSPGTLVDERYEILEALGVGGFATIYKAHQRYVDRLVAVKLLHTSWLDSEHRDLIVARFEREAQASTRIRHPNVVTTFDYGVWDEQQAPYLVMEYLDGEDLEAVLATHGSLPLRQTLELLIPCVEGLAELHLLGFVHRDLKPQNLFLADPGTDLERLVLLDFGIAGLAESSSSNPRLTMLGQMPGTPQYVAPELVFVEPVTPAVDIYQMGLILVEILTGAPVVPQYEDPTECIQAHIGGDLNIPESLMWGPLGEVISRSLARQPGDRYPDAAALAVALRHLLDELSGEQPDTAPGVERLEFDASPLPEAGDPSLLSSRGNTPASHLKTDRSRPALSASMGTHDTLTGNKILDLCESLVRDGKELQAFTLGSGAMSTLARSTDRDALQAFLAGIHRHLRDVAITQLGDLGRSPRLAMSLDEVKWLNQLGALSGFLIGMTDGKTTLRYMLDVAPHPREDVALELWKLLERGVLSV